MAHKATPTLAGSSLGWLCPSYFRYIPFPVVDHIIVARVLRIGLGHIQGILSNHQHLVSFISAVDDLLQY
jgi:hypothetical protein